jgi:hypothetical protein
VNEPETLGQRLGRQIDQLIDLKILALRHRMSHDSIKMLKREHEAGQMTAAIAETINASIIAVTAKGRPAASEKQQAS